MDDLEIIEIMNETMSLRKKVAELESRNQDYENIFERTIADYFNNFGKLKPHETDLIMFSLYMDLHAHEANGTASDREIADALGIPLDSVTELRRLRDLESRKN